MGIWPDPSALDWSRHLRFLKPDLNEEPTLLQARHQLESVFMTDNRFALEWEVCRDSRPTGDRLSLAKAVTEGNGKPNDFLGRPECLRAPDSRRPLQSGNPGRLSPHGCLSGACHRLALEEKTA
ncbi:hypothetical protein [Tichowtungia aerotolerans]|uniref:Uncharacterized protein n=1 Tax=Tichowtungia aerotolerans TaxID=2697043 RepID=A0A6P1MAZ5_9BACT|nr:hypothetical protein [Tichowtungia aerotolerans]QHI68726.1 hypothetical protein GT409_04440 [Tichowtungia aerotolerans]QHI68738.1 hypothetical protein GT409_04500 [Tichowtungia aerotolerans]